MAIDPTGFPLDLTAKNPRNEVTGDVRTLSSNADMTFVPDGGPFYTDTLIVRSGTRILKPITEYVCLHLIKEATRASGYDVSGVIHILDNTISSVTMQYQVVGGEYASTVPIIRALLDNAGAIEKNVNWNTQVYGKPDVFPPAPHFVSGNEFSDWNDVTMALDNIHRSMAYKERASWNSFYTYIDGLIKRNLATIDLSVYYTKTATNALIAGFASKDLVYTKNEITSLYYNKVQLDSMLGDIDGNEFYYTEAEVNAKFIERTVAEAKFATNVGMAKIDTKKADKADIYTRAVSDDKYALKTAVYLKTYIDATLAPLGLSYTKTESDARYATTTAAYTKSQGDLRYALKSQIPQNQDLSNYITRVEVDDRYLKASTADLVFIRKTTADSLYAKISDLEAINTLSKKFANYYEKSTIDNDFATKVLVANTYYNKTESNNLYATKTYTGLTYVTIANFDSFVRDNTILINTKLNTVTAAATYVDKTTLANNYYTQRFIEDNFATLDWVRKTYLSLIDFDTKQALKLDKTVFAARDVETWRELRTKATTAYVDGIIYNRDYLNAQFVRKTELSSSVAVINASIAKQATYTWVDENYFNRTHIDKYYYSRAESEARFYSRAYIDAELVKTSSIAGFLSPYAKTTDVTTVRTSVTTLANNVYTKGQSDGRYLTPASAASTYATTAALTSNVNTLQTSIATRVATTDLTKNYYTKTDTDGLYPTKSYITSTLYTKVQADALFLTKAAYNKAESDLLVNINTRLTTTAAASTYLKISWANANYYTKATIDSTFYTKAYINSTLVTKASFDALSNKVALSSNVSRDILSVVNTFSLYTKTTDIVKNYMTRVDIVRDFAKNDWVTANFEPKNTYKNHYTKAESDAKYSLKTDLTKEVNALRGEINTLRNERQYSIGDIYVTTTHHASAAAVATALGYGTWARYGEGRALIGFSPNGFASGKTDNKYYYNASTAIFGSSFGTFQQWMSLDQMPAHNHSTAPYNRFVSRSSDTGNTSTDGSDWRKMDSEIGVAGISNAQWSQATEKTAGGSKPQDNAQPSVVIGVWRRIR